MIKLSFSILSADFNNLGEQLKILENAGAEYAHLDVMDGHFVPNISIGLPVIESLRKQSNLVFDTHLMITNPKTYIPRFAQAGADIITFHIETCNSTDEVHELITLIKSTGKKVGITLKPQTELEFIFPFIEHIDMALIMSVDPGFGGQKLILKSLDKAWKLRKYLQLRNISLDIEMDGGINLSNIRDVLDAGVNVVVVGSAISDQEDMHGITQEFKKIFAEYNNKDIKNGH